MVRKTFLLSAAVALLLILPVAHLIAGRSASSVTDPTEVLNRYLRAAYARDFLEAYRYISSQDRRLKSEKVYVRERGAFNGFTLEIGRKLAADIEAVPLETNISGNRARVTLKLKLPDANRLSPHLSEWDQDRLNALPLAERRALIEKLDRWHEEGKFPMIEGEESFELVKEAKGWRIFLNWAAGVQVFFRTSVPPSIALEAYPIDHELLIRPGELFTAAFRVKNRSNRELHVRINHQVEPQATAEYLDLVECGLLFPVRLSPKEEGEYSSTYLLRGDLPEGVKRLTVTYAFKNGMVP